MLMEVPSNILWKDTMQWHCARYRFEEHTIHFKNKCMVRLAVSFDISLEQAETYRDRKADYSESRLADGCRY